MSNLIKLSRACIGEEEKQAVCQVIDEGYLGMGQQVMHFEQELEAFFSNNVKVACVNTGTSALQLALQACDIGIGDEVIIPSITYVACFQATSATGALPIICDIDLKTGCIETDNLKELINYKTRAIMYVHYAGGIGNNRHNIFMLAKQYGLRVIEDAAHSFGGYYYDDKRIGESGDITCFSFDGIKNITCGEGGAVVSADHKVINMVKDLRLLGIANDTAQRYAGKRSWDFDVYEQGWRYHMNNINAAIGRVQLKKVDIFGNKRRALARLYKDSIKALPLEFLDLDFNKIIPHIFPILVKDHKRDHLREFLLSHNIEAGIHYKPNHLLTKYKDNKSYPNAEKFGESVLTLPLHPQISDHDVLKISSVVKKYFDNRYSAPQSQVI